MAWNKLVPVLAVCGALAACGADPAALGVTGPGQFVPLVGQQRESGLPAADFGDASGQGRPDGAGRGRYWRYN
jgi:hypothetical protein